jgi:hypothetical protein
MLGPPIQNNINNRVLTGVKAMPMKDSTSDGTNTFSMFRRLYTETIQTGLAKKWYGGVTNTDASRIAVERRTAEVGVGSLNAGAGVISFTKPSDNTTQIRALHRLRNGGATVPAKKTHNPRMF